MAASRVRNAPDRIGHFDGLGSNRQAAGSIHAVLAKAWGSFETWEKDFQRTGLSLAGGSGWMILAYNLHIRSLHNHWAWDYMRGAAAGIPILALDMYEHDFHMDHGTQAAKYIDAWFRRFMIARWQSNGDRGFLCPASARQTLQSLALLRKVGT